MKIAVGASSFASQDDSAISLMLERGYEVVKNPYGRKLTLEETVKHLDNADGLLAGLETLNEQVFSACPKLKAIARIGIGMDNVDLNAAERYGVKVSNTPDGPTYAVAEMTLAALLSLSRQLIPANADVHAGVWKKRMGLSLSGSTILLIGYGRIAKKLEELINPFNMSVFVSDPAYPGLAKGTLEDMLAESDIVSLHAAGKDVILNSERIALMKEGSILLNSARGGLVDEDALYDALKKGYPAWYWADSFTEEPYTGKLKELENAILTPHISTYTGLCRRQMELQAVKNLLEDIE